MAKEETKLDAGVFSQRFIKQNQRKPGEGIHTVYSKYNAVFRLYYGTDPVKAVDSLNAAGKIYKRAALGGAVIYLPSERPKDPLHDRLAAVLKGE